MKIYDCPWELENIGLKTLQIDVNSGDDLHLLCVDDVVHGYDYIVAKVASGNLCNLLFLQDRGFNYVETQIRFSIKYEDFDFNNRLLRPFVDGFCCHEIKSINQFQILLNKITPNMFSTDRVYLDPVLGPMKGYHRYINWLITEYKKGTTIYEFGVNDIMVGFAMSKFENGVVQGLLGGIFEDFQESGYGILTAAHTFLYCRKMGIEIKKMNGDVSSNNFPVVQMYSCLNFRIVDVKTVLVRHN